MHVFDFNQFFFTLKRNSRVIYFESASLIQLRPAETIKEDRIDTTTRIKPQFTVLLVIYLLNFSILYKSIRTVVLENMLV